MKQINELLNDKRAKRDIDEIYSVVFNDRDVKEFLETYNLSVDDEIVQRCRNTLYEFVSMKNKDRIFKPRLVLEMNQIYATYSFRDRVLEERYTIRPKARYDRATEHLRGLTADDYQVTSDNVKAYQAAMNFLNEYTGPKRVKPKGLWIYGTMGTGKTHLLGCLAGELKSNNIAFEMIGVSQFIEDLNASMRASGSNLEKRKDELKSKTRVLLIDDIGTEYATAWNAKTWLDILSYRYDNRFPTIFTSNLTIDGYCNYLANGKNVELSTIERLKHKVLKPSVDEVVMLGQDRRKW